jgi:hypothetical protein
MANVAPRAAPLEAPITKGSAKGFRNSPCNDDEREQPYERGNKRDTAASYGWVRCLVYRDF